MTPERIAECRELVAEQTYPDGDRSRMAHSLNESLDAIERMRALLQDIDDSNYFAHENDLGDAEHPQCSSGCIACAIDKELAT